MDTFAGLIWLHPFRDFMDFDLFKPIGFRFQIFVDLPQRRVADPRCGATLAHHIPARLVLAVVMAAADREVVFGPNDLRAGSSAILARRLNEQYYLSSAASERM
jgi:hypothetical protein